MVHVDRVSLFKGIGGLLGKGVDNFLKDQPIMIRQTNVELLELNFGRALVGSQSVVAVFFLH